LTLEILNSEFLIHNSQVAVDVPARELTRRGRARIPQPRFRFDQRILLLALAAGFPAALVSLILLWTGDYTPRVQWTLTVFTFGGAQRLRLVNRAGERLLGQAADQLLGRHAEDLNLTAYLEGPSPRIADATFSGGGGRWEVRRTTFRQEGRPHQLLVLADV